MLEHIGGDGAVKTYHRVKNRLANKPAVYVGLGAFRSLVGTAAAAPGWELKKMVVEYLATGQFALMTSEEIGTAAHQVHLAYESMIDSGGTRWLTNSDSFYYEYQPMLERLAIDNRLKDAMNLIKAGLHGLGCHYDELGISGDLALERYKQLLLRAGLLAAEANDYIALDWIGNEFKQRRDIELQFDYARMRLLDNLSVRLEIVRNQQGDWEYRDASNRLKECFELSYNAGTVYDLYRADCMVGVEKANINERDVGLGLECVAATSYSLFWHNTPQENRYKLRTNKVNVRDHGYFEGSTARYQDILKLMETREREPKTESRDIQLGKLYVACGHLALLDDDPENILGFDVWECLVKSLDAYRSHNTLSYSLWCDWYLLCTRAMKLSGNNTGLVIARRRAKEMTEQLDGCAFDEDLAEPEVTKTSRFGLSSNERRVIEALIDDPVNALKKRTHMFKS